jgi:hypothetical protein
MGSLFTKTRDGGIGAGDAVLAFVEPGVLVNACVRGESDVSPLFGVSVPGVASHPEVELFADEGEGAEDTDDDGAGRDFEVGFAGAATVFPVAIFATNSSGSFFMTCSQISTKVAPPTIFSTGTSTLSSFKNHDRTSTATSESIPRSTRGASYSIF